MRNPNNPQRYFLSRSRAPALVQADDILEYDLDSNPIVPPVTRPYSERVIHGEIFKARPDVNAVCHHHAPSIMPFAISGVPLLPVFHLGAAMGPRAPFWDSRDEFGDTNLLVVKPEEGASLARALGSHSVVRDAPPRRDRGRRRHARARVPHDLFGEERRASARRACARDMSRRSPTAKPRWRAQLNLAPGPLARAYEYWVRRLAEREGRGKSDPILRAAEAAGAQAEAERKSAQKAGRRRRSAKPKGKKDELC